MTNPPNADKYDRIFWTFLAVLTGARLFCIGRFELFYDEAFYWLCSCHPALNYHTNTPLVNYVIRLFTLLGGSTEFFVRLGSVIIGAGILLLIYRTASVIFNRQAALLSALVITFTPLYLPVGFIISPDMPLMFFWLLTVYLLWKIFSGDSAAGGHWYLAGAGLGVGLLSKDLMVLLIPCVFLYLLVSPRNRRWLGRKEPWAALVIALLIFSPVIVWNFSHSFASFTFHLSGIHRDAEAPLIKNPFLHYITLQALFTTPLVFILLLSSAAYAFYSGLRDKREDLLFLACVSAPLFLFFAFCSFFVVTIKPHWMACGYLTAAMLLSYFIQRTFSFPGNRARKLLLALPLLLTFITVGLTLLTAALTVTGGFLPLPQKTVSYLHDRFDFIPGCWKTCGERVNAAYGELSKTNKVFIFGANEYRTISLVAFYARKPYQSYLLEPSESGIQFNFWQDADRLAGSDAVFVGKEIQSVTFPFARYFASVTEAEPVVLLHRGEPRKVLYLRRCYNFKGIVK